MIIWKARVSPFLFKIPAYGKDVFDGKWSVADDADRWFSFFVFMRRR